jgi:hypothetical protein
LTAQELSTLFSTRIEVTSVGQAEVFWVRQDS